MKKILIPISIITALVGIVAVANPVLALSGKTGARLLELNASTTASTSSTTLKQEIKKAAVLDKTAAALQTRASKEIDRRITALTKLQTKIQGMKKITPVEQSDFATTVQAQINLLNNLKTKINADTDIATLRADVQSITKAYRIYLLILPQIEIIAAADRLASTSDLLSTYATKLQTRITTAQVGGANVTALQILLTDMNVKIVDANNQSASATASVVILKPDNGDKTIMAANAAALKTARTDITTGTKDLKDAQKAAGKIRVGLTKALHGLNATSTATTTATTTP